MKPLRARVIAVAFAPLAAAGTSHAHGGGTNADGCHNNRSTGDYHFHGAKRAPAPAPVRRGQPGYGSHLDRDNDGVGCE